MSFFAGVKIVCHASYDLVSLLNDKFFPDPAEFSGTADVHVSVGPRHIGPAAAADHFFGTSANLMLSIHTTPFAFRSPKRMQRLRPFSTLPPSGPVVQKKP